jgi:hypothetical protein
MKPNRGAMDMLNSDRSLGRFDFYEKNEKNTMGLPCGKSGQKEAKRKCETESNGSEPSKKVFGV